MVSSIDEFCRLHRVSGCHFLYVDPDWRSMMNDYGYSTWINHNYVWQDRQFQNFDDYLSVFNANQRRNIKRERKAVKDVGLTLSTVTGAAIDPQLFPQMYAFYADTCDKFGWWGSKYLTPEFFDRLSINYRHRVVFVTAYGEDSATPVGMSFCITKGERLYGRYWGSSEEVDCLHFDACYYTPIEWAIQQGIKIFDPGAGGRHKKRRGFPATANFSLHRFYHPRFSKILSDYLEEFNELQQQEIVAINQDLPMKITTQLTLES
jgi:predicted N-acyltransferase